MHSKTRMMRSHGQTDEQTGGVWRTQGRLISLYEHKKYLYDIFMRRLDNRLHYDLRNHRG